MSSNRDYAQLPGNEEDTQYDHTPQHPAHFAEAEPGMELIQRSLSRASTQSDREEFDYNDDEVGPTAHPRRIAPPAQQTTPSSSSENSPREASTATGGTHTRPRPAAVEIDVAEDHAVKNDYPQARPLSGASYLTTVESRSSLYGEWKGRLRDSVSPSTHNLLDAYRKGGLASIAGETARPYHHWRQTWRLYRLAAAEFLFSVILCIFYVAVLVHFSRKHVLDAADKTWINALSQGFSFVLGMNIAGSFRSYAKLLRWLVLSYRFRKLEIFDLIMGADSLANVFKIVVKARRGGKGFMRYVPTQTQVVCGIWFALNLTVTIFVGYIGSVWGLEFAGSDVLTVPGITSITNFTALGTEDYRGSISRIQQWGVRGFRAHGHLGIDHVNASTSAYNTLQNGTTAYWSLDFNPDDPTLHAISRRQLRADASCQEFKVIEGQYGNQSYFIYDDGLGQQPTYTYPEESQPGPGGFLTSSYVNSTCGHRCTNIDAFIAATDPDKPIRKPGRNKTIVFEEAKFFRCTNTFQPVQVLRDKKLGDVPASLPEFQIGDSLAQMLAGAIGWDSDEDQLDNARPDFSTYPAWTEIGSYLGLHYTQATPSAANMSDMISSFTMRALVAADNYDLGLVFYQNVTWHTPVLSQKLSVDWPSMTWVFSCIIAGQAVALVLVFIFAGQAIIKSDSPLSLAKVYFSLLQHYNFADRGCMLKGEEMIDMMGNPKVRYGWINGRRMDENDQPIRHLDVFIEDTQAGKEMSANFRHKTKYKYDGGLNVDSSIDWDGDRELRHRIHKKYRDFDANEIFS